MKSRDVIAESSELNDLKELRLVYPWWQAVAILIGRTTILIGRTIGRPTQWKVDLHTFALSFLPAVVAVHANLAMSGAIGTTFWISMGLYAIMVFMVVFLKGLSKKVRDNKTARNKVGISLIILVSAAFLPVFTKGFGGSPTNEAWAGLATAAVTAIISHKWLALDPKYLAEAEKAPHLLTESEKYLLKIAVSECVILMAVSFRKWLPKNVLTDMKQMTCYVIGLVRENIPMTIIVGSGLAVLLYYLFK